MTDRKIKSEICDLGKSGLSKCKLGLVQIATPDEMFQDSDFTIKTECLLPQLQKILKYLQEGIQKECDILVLPEYSTSPEIVEAVTTASGRLWDQLTREEQVQYDNLKDAWKNKILIAGSYSREKNGCYYNSCPVVAFGKVYLQDKLRPTQKEQVFISGGKRLNFFINSGWGDFVVAICYDFMDGLFDGLQNRIDHLFVIARNPAVERFKSHYAIPRCSRLYAFVSIANDARLGGGTAVYAPYHYNCEQGNLGWRQENLLLIDCPMTEFDKARGGEKSTPFQAPPPGITRFDSRSSLATFESVVSSDTDEDGSTLVYVNNIVVPKAESQGYSLEWSDYFEGDDYPKGHQIKTPKAWNEKLLPKIKKLKQHLDEQNVQKQLKIEIFARLSIGFALGYVFSGPSGYRLLVYQGNHYTNKTELWYSGDKLTQSELHTEFAEYDASLTVYQKITGLWKEKTQELVVMISVANKVVADVEKYLSRSHLNCHNLLKFIPKDGAARTAISNSAQAIGIARFIGDQLRKYRSEYGFDKIHLFYSGPLALAIFIGQNLNACGPIQIYEHLEPGYAPSFLLK